MPAFDWSKGFVQRANRNSYSPNELIDALNIAPAPEGGGVQTRLGDVVFHTVPGGGRVHSLYQTHTAEGTPVQYQGSGSVLARDFVPIVTGLTGTPLSFATMQGFGENHMFTFFAGGQEALRVKDDGSVLTSWGLPSPTPPIAGAFSPAAGRLAGFYAWKQVFVRKPVITGGVFGRWFDGTQTYDLTGTLPFLLSDGTTNSGTVFGAPKPWAEVVLTLTAGTNASPPAIDVAYWNGLLWAPAGSGTLEQFAPTLTGLRMDGDVNNWLPVNGLYLFRVRVLTATATMPEIVGSVFFDGVYTARSNPSPSGPVTGEYGPTPLTATAATVPFSNPLTGPDLVPQATHVALYRTTGDDAAAQTPGVIAEAAALYFFERDFPAGSTTLHLSTKADRELGELLELDNDRPPAFETIAEYQGRIFGATGNRLHFSKRYFPEAFPGTNYLDIGSPADPIRRIGQYHGNLNIWTPSRVYLLVGNDENSYDTRLVQCPTGLGAPQSVAEGEQSLLFLGSDGQLWGLQGTIAASVSRIGHQQLFDGVTLHGVAGLSTVRAARNTCVGHWGKGRYRFSYPLAGDATPTTSLMVDEARGSWWRDSRGWQSLFYDRTSDTWYGGLQGGMVVQLESGTTDRGAPIQATLQTMDDAMGANASDKDLAQLAVELETSPTGVSVTPVVSYVVAGVPLGTLVSPTTAQLILPAPAPGTYRGLTLGYVLAGVAPWALFGLIPQVLRWPVRSSVWQTLPTTLAWPGPKILDSLLLDVDLASGVLTWQLYGDSILIEEGVLETVGRHVVQLLTQRHEATVFELTLQGTGVFLLHQGSVLSARPLPEPIYTDIIVPGDLGTVQDKVGLAFVLDIDLLQPGTVTTTFYADGVLIHTHTFTGVGRQRTERLRLPSQMHGRLFEIRRESTAPYRLWPGTELTFAVIGVPQEQHYRQVSEPFGQSQQLPLLQLPHTEEA
jgi:hypothetical protein